MNTFGTFILTFITYTVITFINYFSSYFKENISEIKKHFKELLTYQKENKRIFGGFESKYYRHKERQKYRIVTTEGHTIGAYWTYSPILAKYLFKTCNPLRIKKAKYIDKIEHVTISGKIISSFKY